MGIFETAYSKYHGTLLAPLESRVEALYTCQVLSFWAPLSTCQASGSKRLSLLLRTELADDIFNILLNLTFWNLTLLGNSYLLEADLHRQIYGMVDCDTACNSHLPW